MAYPSSFPEKIRLDGRSWSSLSRPMQLNCLDDLAFHMEYADN